jgi:hypothetical protein
MNDERRTNPLQRDILQAIVEEREKQRRMVATYEEDKNKPPGDWVGTLTIWLGKAAQETPLSRGRAFSPGMFRRRLIQIAAICLAALETIDDEREEDQR